MIFSYPDSQNAKNDPNIRQFLFIFMPTFMENGLFCPKSVLFFQYLLPKWLTWVVKKSSNFTWVGLFLAQIYMGGQFSISERHMCANLTIELPSNFFTPKQTGELLRPKPFDVGDNCIPRNVLQKLVKIFGRSRLKMVCGSGSAERNNKY